MSLLTPSVRTPCKINCYIHKVFNLLKLWLWPIVQHQQINMFCPEDCKKKRFSHENRSDQPSLPKDQCQKLHHMLDCLLFLHTFFTASLTVRINSAAGSCIFSTGTHSCGPGVLWWFHEQIKFSATSFATYVVTQEMQNIVTGQTTISKF